MRSYRIVAGATLLAGLMGLAVVFSSDTPAGAFGSNGIGGPVTSCGLGSAYNNSTNASANISLSVNGSNQPESATDIFGPYSVQICRDTGNHVYSVSVTRWTLTNSVYYQLELTAADAGDNFSVTFTPTSTDTPLVANGQADIQSLSINGASNTVTVVSQPLAYLGINGCTTEPALTCATDPNYDTSQYLSYVPYNINFGVRYEQGTTSSSPGASFGQLPGMFIGASAYIFNLSASCTTNPNRDQSFNGIQIQLAGPHQNASGGLNNGSFDAVIPQSAITQCFGESSSQFTSQVTVSRAENGQTVSATSSCGSSTDKGLCFQTTTTPGGSVEISVPQVTFSQPTYDISTAIAKSTGSSNTSSSSGTKSTAKKPKVTIKSTTTTATATATSIALACETKPCMGTAKIEGPVKVSVKVGAKTSVKTEIKVLASGSYKLAVGKSGTSSLALTTYGKDAFAKASVKTPLHETAIAEVSGGNTATKGIKVT